MRVLTILCEAEELDVRVSTRSLLAVRECNYENDLSNIHEDLIGERAKRARHSHVCSIENRGYIYIVRAIRANFVLITRKEGGA